MLRKGSPSVNYALSCGYCWQHFYISILATDYNSSVVGQPLSEIPRSLLHAMYDPLITCTCIDKSDRFDPGIPFTAISAGTSPHTLRHGMLVSEKSLPGLKAVPPAPQDHEGTAPLVNRAASHLCSFVHPHVFYRQEAACGLSWIITILSASRSLRSMWVDGVMEEVILRQTGGRIKGSGTPHHNAPHKQRKPVAVPSHEADGLHNSLFDKIRRNIAQEDVLFGSDIFPYGCQPSSDPARNPVSGRIAAPSRSLGLFQPPRLLWYVSNGLRPEWDNATLGGMEEALR